MAIEPNRSNLNVGYQQNWLAKLFPFLYWFRHYQRDDLPGDLIAGFTVATMLVPQSMAYAVLAGLPPIVGLYTGIAPVLIYGLLGSARILTLGPTAITSVMILSSIGGLANLGSDAYFTLSLTLALTLGIVYLVMGLLRLGFVVNLVSQSVLEGYVNAAALIIVISQINTLLGIDVPLSPYPAETLHNTLFNLDHIHLPTFALGLICISIIWLFNSRLNSILLILRLGPRLRIMLTRSGPLVSVLTGTMLVVIFQLDEFGVSVIGEVPQGFPSFALGPYDFSEWQPLLIGAVAIAFVGFMEGFSTAKTLMSKGKQTFDANQELFAMGAANIAGAATGGMASTTSISRSAVNFSTGAHTGLSSVIAALIVGLVVSFFTPLLYYLPNTTLAAIILTSVVRLFNVRSIQRLLSYSWLDTIPFFVTFIATFFISIPIGIASGIVVSLGAYLVRTSQPQIVEQGRVNYTEHYQAVDKKVTHRIPGVLIIRIDESLYFANAQFLDKHLRNTIATSTEIKHLILVGDAINWLDTSALQILEDLIRDLEEINISVFITQLNPKVWRRINKIGYTEQVGKERFFQRTHDAVVATGQLLDDELPI